MENLSDRLRRLRNENDLTVKEVAEVLGIPVTTYREWENGRKIVGEPYIGLSKVFGISVYELITGEKNSKVDLIASLNLIDLELAKIRQHLLSTE